LTTVRDSGEALLTVINDILDFSKIEAGKMALDCSTFDLRDSLGDTMKSFAVRADRQGVELALEIHSDVPSMVVGDYNRLRQIVINLVGNALKFTESGEVLLSVVRQWQTEQEVELHFTVHDTGIGVPDDKRTAIFEMFEQVDSTLRRRHGGTGLGLAIASRLVELMAGRIWVESELGQGSKFHFTARFGLPEEIPDAGWARWSSLQGLPVLVVDDNATNCRILHEILGNWRMAPTIARGAAEALDLLRAGHAAGQPFSLLLTDAHMPDVDGFTLVEQIRRDPQIESTVVMMLTSGDCSEEISRCEELGLASYLLKPVKQSELLDAIRLALGVGGGESEAHQILGRQPKPIGSLRILLAEDSLVNQKLAVALLEGQGHQIHVANNGKEALAALQSQAFDLVLMDVQMPEIDGLETTMTIRAREMHTGSHVPIIAMTAHALKGDRERCLKAGMDGYIAKPIHGRELFDVIENLCGCRAPPPPLPRVIDPGELDAVDWPMALEAVHGDPLLLRTIARAAVEELPRLARAMQTAVRSGDASALRLAAHTLKGSLRYFGEGPAFASVCGLERMGIDDRVSDAAPLSAAAESEIGRIVQSLQEFLHKNP
ncbi:MAG: response regulator, partial [Thermoguttaceae bacterium]